MTCPVCKGNDSSSPTGSWCRSCGYQNPCPCWKGAHAECLVHINQAREKSGMKLATTCCCNSSGIKTMTNKPNAAQLQKLIDKMAYDSRKALKMAKAVYGLEAQLFCESDCLVVMDGDEGEGVEARNVHVRLSAKGLFPVGGGAF